MTDQEFDQELNQLMDPGLSGKKKKRIRRFWKKWSRKRKIITVAAVFAVAAVVALSFTGKEKIVSLPVMVSSLSKGDIQEVLSVSGPVSGTDSAEVVSNLHAEILNIAVKEGDKVTKDQILATLDQTDALRELDIAKNAYDLAAANLDEARQEAENGYAKAVQDLEAAKRDYDRKAALLQSGDIPQTEFEAARDVKNDAERQLSSYTLENGRPVANRSYHLQLKNAEFELEQKQKRLEETEVTSPIAGTVVRVNSRVGRFADMVDDDKPLFIIDNLESLEMQINVSEYSIGKVQVGQLAQIRADILDGMTEDGIITSISPTGEEKGGGSTERVIPTTIKIQSNPTRLIAGITARAEIVLNEAQDAWVVPISAILQKGEASYLAAVKDGVVELIPVEVGVESDIQTEILGEGLLEGISYITAPDPSLETGTSVMVIPTM